MPVLQTMYLETVVALETEEAAKFEETRVLPSSVFEAGVVVKPNGRHYVPAEHSWNGDDINFELEDEFVLRTGWEPEAEEEVEEEPEEPELESEEID